MIRWNSTTDTVLDVLHCYSCFAHYGNASGRRAGTDKYDDRSLYAAEVYDSCSLEAGGRYGMFFANHSPECLHNFCSC